MSEVGYQSGSTLGGQWGCGIAALIGRPLFFFLMLMDALGDCAPDAGCHKGFLSMVLLPTVLITAPIELGARWLVNQNWRDGS
jgi:hypothetical protein